MTKNGYWRVLAAAAIVAALAYGCGGRAAVDHSGSLVSDEGQIALTRATKFTPPEFESEVYTIDVDGSGERRLTDSPGLDAFPAWSPMESASLSPRTATAATGSSTPWTPTARSNGA